MNFFMENLRTMNPMNGEDLIGLLPDDVLGFIVSTLTMKEAGRTSVLSQRWKNMWLYTTSFNFDASKRIMDLVDEEVVKDDEKRKEKEEVVTEETRKYLNWVNKLVENHMGSDLSELVIAFPLDRSHSCHLDKWIDFALRKRVKAIKIDLDPMELFTTSRRRYSFIETAPRTPGIECLTSLFLNYVGISGELVEHLLSVCPLLERLSLRALNQISNVRIVGSSLKLKYLNIELWDPEVVIVLCTPNLLSFHFQGSAKELEVEDLSSLVDLGFGGVDLSDQFERLESYFPQLATLTFDFDYFTLQSCLELHEALEWSKFTNLRHLTIQIYKSGEQVICLVTKFINLGCPNLHKFRWETPVCTDLDEEETVGSFYQEQHKCLKVVEIIGFVGKSHEIKFVEYFVGFAKLEKLIIDTRYEYDPDDRESITRARPMARQLAEQIKLPPQLHLLII